MKKDTEQTSRLLYRKQDHKDICMMVNVSGTDYERRFHGGFALKDTDEEGRLLLWRKMFKDRYVICQLTGGGFAGFWGVFYPKEKTLEYGGYVGNMVKCDEEVMLYQITQTENVFLASKDGKLIKQSTIDGAYNGFLPFFNGIIVRPLSSRNETTFVNFKENEFLGLNREVDTQVVVGNYSDFATVNVPRNGSARCSIERDYNNDEIKDGQRVRIAFKFWNAITKQFFGAKINAENLDGKKGINYVVSGNIVGANGRTFVLFQTSDIDEKTGDPENWYYTIYEYSPTGMHKIGYTPKVLELFSYGSLALKYHSGLYYLYQTFYSKNGVIQNRIYTSSDMNSFTGYKPQDIVYLRDYKGENEIELIMNGVYSGRNAFNCYSLNTYENPVYEDNKLVKNASDVSWSNNDVVYYFDNLKLAPSGNNFYFFASQMGYGGTQQMFDKYYDLESEDKL